MQKDNERFLLEYERKASEGKYAEAVIGLIEDTMTVTFAEIDNFLSSYIETQGSIEMSHPDYANLILWTRMSEPFAKTMNEVLTSKKVNVQPTSHLTYLFDGAALNLPVASKVHAYMTPHWLPELFNPRREERKSAAVI